jgi:alanine racemase
MAPNRTRPLVIGRAHYRRRVTIRLTVDRVRWWAHVTDVAQSVHGLVPVVKGNGYGFGREQLAAQAVKLSPLLAVGNVHELAGLPDQATPIVLTPILASPMVTSLSKDVVMTVGNKAHIEALRGWGGRVIVKLTSDMRRYGGDIELVATAQRAGLRTVGVAIHPPIKGPEEKRVSQIVSRLGDIDPSLDVWLSHLAPDSYESLPPTHSYHLRLGTYLWHGDREALELEADVIDTRPAALGDLVGYRQVPVSSAGTIVMIGAGSANHVAPLADGRSPFHFARQRLSLLEPPHMHTSMAFVPEGEPCPVVGDWVDLQRPLIHTNVDELRWI